MDPQFLTHFREVETQFGDVLDESETGNLFYGLAVVLPAHDHVGVHALSEKLQHLRVDLEVAVKN